MRSGNAFMSTGNNEPGKLCLVVRQDVHLVQKCGECVRSGNAFVTTVCGEAGKPCEVGLWNVHLVQKCGECVRGGNVSVTTAHREDGKQRKVHALYCHFDRPEGVEKSAWRTPQIPGCGQRPPLGMICQGYLCG
ncbi:MAG: hypothetical protein IAB75_11890 [Bacteroidetes bacterium]|uniref:Uncharacterized protein n=1 Tax=Candidatus Cryptobacteroides avicola TaxID=2840757 RepID=A0A940DZ35_9BACT|nr:hypothetical protein [Candidatus Cryptobacteroides avicola]